MIRFPARLPSVPLRLLCEIEPSLTGDRMTSKCIRTLLQTLVLSASVAAPSRVGMRAEALQRSNPMEDWR